MRVLVAPNPFKGSLTAGEVSAAIRRGVLSAWPSATVDEVPLADGGEGTVDCFLRAQGGETVELEVTGPFGDLVTAQYAILPGGEIAVIEMAQASGLTLVPEERGLDPMRATTYGTGQLIKNAIERGCSSIVVGIGGSATVDGGSGMALALGATFRGGDGNHIEPRGGASLPDVKLIDASAVEELMRGVTVTVACDVDNPLYGENGAAPVYGPQKGADRRQVELLDSALKHWGELLQESFSIDPQAPGAGAAGGLGAGLMAFTSASLRPGIEVVLSVSGLKETIDTYDLIITGEGRLDRQTAFGKGPQGIAEAASAAGVPVVAVVGQVSGDVDVARVSFPAVSIVNRVMSLEEAMGTAETLLEEAARGLCELLALGGRVFRCKSGR